MVQAYLSEGIQDCKRRNNNTKFVLHIKITEHHNTSE